MSTPAAAQFQRQESRGRDDPQDDVVDNYLCPPSPDPDASDSDSDSDLDSCRRTRHFMETQEDEDEDQDEDPDEGEDSDDSADLDEDEDPDEDNLLPASVHVVKDELEASNCSATRCVIAVYRTEFSGTKAQYEHMRSGGYFRMVWRQYARCCPHLVSFRSYYEGGNSQKGANPRFIHQLPATEIVKKHLVPGVYFEYRPVPEVWKSAEKRVRAGSVSEEDMLVQPSKRARESDTADNAGPACASDLDSFAAEMKMLSTSVETMQTVISIAESRYRDAITTNDDLVNNIDELKSALGQASDRVRDLENACQDISRQYTQLEEVVEDREFKAIGLKMDRGSLKSALQKMDNLSKELAEACFDRDSANERARASASALETSEKALAKMEANLLENTLTYRKEKEASNEQLAALRTELQKVRSDNDTLQQSHSKEAKGLKKEKKAHAATRSAWTAAVEEKVALRGEINRLLTEDAQQRAKNSELYRELLKENKALHAQIVSGDPEATPQASG